MQVAKICTFVLRRRTTIAVCLLLGAILNIVGDLNTVAPGYSQNCIHGWPLAYLVRASNQDTAGQLGYGTAMMSVLPVHDDVVAFSPMACLMNMCIVAAITVACVAFAEQWFGGRRKCQILLRDLFLVMATGALLLACARRQAITAQQQHAIVQQLKGMGVWVWFELGDPDWLRIAIGEEFWNGQSHRNSMNRFFQAAWHRYVPKERFALDLSMVDPADVKTVLKDHAVQLGDVKSLECTNMALYAEDIRYLANFTELERLSLQGSTFPRESFNELSRLAELRILRLDETAVTDDDLRDIGTMRSLESLNLDGTEISNQGIRDLRHLHNLRELYLNNTIVTEDGLNVFGDRLQVLEADSW